MPLQHIIAHRIQRLEPINPANLELQNSCWANDGRVEECFRELKTSVMKRFTKDYGRFSADYANHPLSSWLKAFTEEKLGFETFSKKAMEHFKSEIDKTDVVVDGFIFFAHEQLEHEECAHFFLVQHNTGQYIDGNLAINESFYLDTSNVKLSAKVNISDWLSGDKYRANNAVSLLRWRGEKDLTETFAHFIGFADKIDLATETDEFLNNVSEYTKKLPEDIAFHTKKKVVDYCLEQSKAGKPVVIDKLSSKLASEPVSSSSNSSLTSVAVESTKRDKLPPLSTFTDFISAHSQSHKPEIIPDKSKLAQFIRISGRDHNLSLSFSTNCLGDSITYDTETDSLTIRNLPPALKTKLLKHLQFNK